MHGTCPNCGYCPTCGRSNPRPNYPWTAPYVQPWRPFNPSPWWQNDGTMVQIKQPDTYIGDPPNSFGTAVRAGMFNGGTFKITY